MKVQGEGEKAEVLRSTGFVDMEFAQTLTRHPKHSNDSVEEPSDGFDRGDYVASGAGRPSLHRKPDSQLRETHAGRVRSSRFSSTSR